MAAYAKQQMQTPPRYTPQEYLERERNAETKSEYDDGQIVAMAGASPEHNAIAFNLSVEMGTQLRDKNCRGYSSDLRVRVSACNRYFYPDITLVCGEPQFEALTGLRSLLNPTLIIEVLSESTEAKDRGKKFICYQTLESLDVYIMVAQDLPRIERYTRQEDGSWRYDMTQGMDAVLRLETIGCELRLSDIYANVEFPPIAATEPEE